MKKVLIINNSTRGIANFRIELIEELIESGYIVHIAVPSSRELENVIKKNKRLIIHDLYLEPKSTSVINEIKTIKNIKGIIEVVKPDMILTYTIKPNIYTGLVLKAKSKKNIKFIPNITGLGESIQNNKKLKSKLYLYLYKFALRSANLVFLQNEGINNILQLDKSQIVNIPGSGVNLKKFEFYPLSEEEITEEISITYLGRLMKSKGTYDLIKAIEFFVNKYPEYPVIFNLIGDFKDVHIETKLSENKDKIKYLPYSEQVVDIIRHSTFIINPSHHEGMSNILLEGAAIGRPLLASDIYGCREIVSNRNGLLFEAQNYKNIISVLEKVMELKSHEIIEMGKKSRDLVENKFDRNIVNKVYLSQIENLIRGN